MFTYRLGHLTRTIDRAGLRLIDGTAVLTAPGSWRFVDLLQRTYARLPGVYKCYTYILFYLYGCVSKYVITCHGVVPTFSFRANTHPKSSPNYIYIYARNVYFFNVFKTIGFSFFFRRHRVHLRGATTTRRSGSGN